MRYLSLFVLGLLAVGCQQVTPPEQPKSTINIQVHPRQQKGLDIKMHGPKRDIDIQVPVI